MPIVFVIFVSINYWIMDILEKIKSLPLDKQKEVEGFVDSLLEKSMVETHDTISLAEERRKNFGRLKGKIWIADDFDQTPEEFNEYL